MRPEVAIYAALLVILAIALTLSSSVMAGSASPGEWAWFLGCVAVVAISLPVLAMRDRHALAVFVMLAALVSLAGQGLAMAVTEVPTFGQWAKVVLAGTVLACAGVYLAFSQLRRDGVPDVLQERIGRRGVFERHGVQLAAIGYPEYLNVYLQNCTDQDRTIAMRFEDGSLFRQKTLPVVINTGEPVSLGPGEVKVLALPLRSASANGARVDLALVPQITGKQGKRIRGWRARALVSPTPIWVLLVLMVAVLPLGMYLIVWGRGGVRLRMNVPPPYRHDPLPDAGATTLWAPMREAA